MNKFLDGLAVAILVTFLCVFIGVVVYSCIQVPPLAIVIVSIILLIFAFTRIAPQGF